MSNRDERAARRAVSMTCVLALLTAGVSLERQASAQATTAKTNNDAPTAKGNVTGNVVKLDAGDVFLDVGVKQGAVVGDVLELWRPITVKHPVTGKLLSDRFRIGSVKVTQVGDVISLAKPEGTLLRAVEPGDVVVLPRALPIAPPPPPAGTGVEKPKPGGATPPPILTVIDDDEADELGVLFDGLLGADLPTRITRFEGWAKAHPSSRYVKAVIEEANALRALAEDKSGTNSAATDSGLPPAPRALSFEKPSELLENTATTIALEVEGPVIGVVLHFRRSSEPAYQSLPMKATGAGYFSVTLPKEKVVAPSLDFFIEAVGTTGGATAIVGSADKPDTLSVAEAPKVSPPKSYKTVAALWTDYADYNRLLRNDYAWQTEGWFGLRFFPEGDVGLRAVRSGFGVYKGQGGAVVDLDQTQLAARSVGLSYGYLEAEWGFIPAFSIIGRAVIGLGDGGITGGGQAFVRIGNDKKTNLMIGGEFLGGVGVRGITQVELNMFPRFPIMLRSEVTNQPAGSTVGNDQSKLLTGQKQSTGDGDLGVRAIAQVGYRVSPELTLFLRASYQGRTINHSGPGVGAGAMFSW